MNVTLSRRGSYAAAAAICLARAYGTGRPVKLREISAQMDIPRSFVSQIVGDLVRAGIAVSSLGRDGGHRLARTPDQVSVAEVIEAAEGPLASDRCALGDGPCRWQDVCPLHETMSTATASMRAILAGTSLAVLAERDAAIALRTYPVPADAHAHPTAVGITDSVHVELPAAVIAARLRVGASWLTACAEACDAEELRVRVGPGGRRGWLGKTVAIHLGHSQQTDDSLVTPFVWEASGPGGIFPRFEGDLRLTALDPERSQLLLSGSYRPTLGKAGQVLNDAVLGKLAQATLRSFLRQIARGLEYDQAPITPAAQ